MQLPPSTRKGLKTPVFIEGLPGLGNVGKIAVDLLVEQTGAKRLLRIPVSGSPTHVLVQEDNMVRFPGMALYHLRLKRRDFLILTGDAQPEEPGAFAEELLAMLEEVGCSEIVTIGGIGLREPPEEPQVFVTGSDRHLVARFKGLGANGRIYGVVGPIIGATGVLLGAAKGRIPAAGLLAESFAHPMYIGLRGAAAVLRLLSKAYGFSFDMAEVDASIDALERPAPAGEFPKKPDETTYIG